MRAIAILLAVLVLAGPTTAATCRKLVVRDEGAKRDVKVTVCGGPALARGRL